MLPVGSIVSDAATGFGLMAVMIAVCGFVGQAPAALKRKNDLAVLPQDVPNAAEGRAIADRAVASGVVVVLEPVWQGSCPVL